MNSFGQAQHIDSPSLTAVGERRKDVPPARFAVHLPQFSRNEEHRGRNGYMTLNNFDKVSGWNSGGASRNRV